MFAGILSGCGRGDASPRAPMNVDVTQVGVAAEAAGNAPDQPAIQMSIAERRACLRIAGSVACAHSEEDFWRFTELVPAPDASRVLSVSVGDGGFFWCVAMAGGPPACAGTNVYAQLGAGLSDGGSEKLVRVVDVPEAIEVSAGFAHACARTADGAVYCWGLNGSGETGGSKHFEANDRALALPERVPGLRATRVVAGKAASCALTTAGVVECWGAPVTEAQEPNGGTERVAIPGVDHATDLDGNARAFCAVQDEEVLCWGHTYMLFAERDRQYARVPVRVGVGGARRVRVGSSHACALTKAGTVECWGYGSSGQLGRVIGADAQEGPAPVEGLGRASDVFVGHTTGCAVLERGRIDCWGSWAGARPDIVTPRPLRLADRPTR